jgi:hypothetical protein
MHKFLLAVPHHGMILTTFLYSYVRRFDNEEQPEIIGNRFDLQ